MIIQIKPGNGKRKANLYRTGSVTSSIEVLGHNLGLTCMHIYTDI